MSQWSKPVLAGPLELMRFMTDLAQKLQNTRRKLKEVAR